MIVTVDDILAEYRHLQKTPSGEMHGINYQRFRDMVRDNQDVFYQLIFSGKVSDDKELHELILFGGHGGSVAKEDNQDWIPFVQRVWDRRNDLPKSVRDAIEWRVAQWGIIE